MVSIRNDYTFSVLNLVFMNSRKKKKKKKKKRFTPLVYTLITTVTCPDALCLVIWIFLDPSHHILRSVTWSDLLVVFGFNGPLRQYFSLYRAVSQVEGERKEK